MNVMKTFIICNLDINFDANFLRKMYLFLHVLLECSEGRIYEFEMNKKK